MALCSKRSCPHSLAPTRPRNRQTGAGCFCCSTKKRKVACYPELTRGGLQRLVVFAAEAGGCWSDERQQFLLRLCVQCSPQPSSAAQGWARHWWSVLSVALQRAVASSEPGVWSMPPLPDAPDPNFVQSAAAATQRTTHVQLRPRPHLLACRSVSEPLYQPNTSATVFCFSPRVFRFVQRYLHGLLPCAARLSIGHR